MANIRLSRRDKMHAWLGFVLCTLWMSLGCNPSTIGFILAPFFDANIPPIKHKLSLPDREVTVALLCTFPTGNITRLDLARADDDLAEKLAMELTKKFKENKEKVKIVPLSQVRSYQKRMAAKGVVSDHDIGRHFKADYVLALDINAMELHEPGSQQTLFRGSADINVRLVDMSKPSGEGQVVDDAHRALYPTSGPRDAGFGDVRQFRALFLTRVARDLSRWFTSFPSDQKREWDMD